MQCCGPDVFIVSLIIQDENVSSCCLFFLCATGVQESGCGSVSGWVSWCMLSYIIFGSNATEYSLQNHIPTFHDHQTYSHEYDMSCLCEFLSGLCKKLPNLFAPHLSKRCRMGHGRTCWNLEQGTHRWDLHQTCSHHRWFLVVDMFIFSKVQNINVQSVPQKSVHQFNILSEPES